MKDKTAAVRKKQRRIQKSAELQRAKRKVYDGIIEYRDERGIKTKLGLEEVYRVHKQVENELFEKSMLIAFLAVMYAMNKDFGYGRDKKLPEVVDACRWALLTISNNERSNTQFNDELEDELGFNVMDMVWERFQPLQDEKLLTRIGWKQLKAADTAGIASRIPHMIVMLVYSIYYNFRFMSKRVAKLIDLVSEYSIDILKNDKFGTYAAELQRRTDIRITKDGMIYHHYSLHRK